MAVAVNGALVIVSPAGGAVAVIPGSVGTIPVSMIPTIAISNPYIVADEAARLALESADPPVEAGEWVVQQDDESWWLYDGSSFVSVPVLTPAQQTALSTLATDLAAKAPLASPVFTGSVRTPVTAVAGPASVQGYPGVTYQCDLTGGAIAIAEPTDVQLGDCLKVTIEAGDPSVNNITVCGLTIDSGDTDSAWLVEKFASEWRKRGG